MVKYNFEFKKKVVLKYLNGEGGARYLSKKYGITNDSSVKRWINNYKAFGNEGLMPSRQNKNYSFEYKMMVVELYLSSKLSFQELAIKEKIFNPATITKWVNDFKIAGPDALRPKGKGCKKTMDKLPKDIKTKSVDTSAEHIKELEEELLKLRIENAYLKELRRLRLEEEALQKKQRELSTASEDSSN